jgi:hypothetical protein
MSLSMLQRGLQTGTRAFVIFPNLIVFIITSYFHIFQVIFTSNIYGFNGTRMTARFSSLQLCNQEEG